MNLDRLTERIKQVSDLYAADFEIERDDDWYVFKLQEELGELTQKYLMMTGRARTKGLSKADIASQFRDEVADTFSLIVLLARHFDIDLDDAVKDKWLKHLE